MMPTTLVSVIDYFDAPPYEWLSNMYPTPIVYDGLEFTCTEAAFHSAKVFDPDLKRQFTGIDGYEAKALGRSVLLRPDWADVRVGIMRDVNRIKFAPGTDLAAKLLDTGDAELIEGNTWGDRIWGVYNGKGQNLLGKVLMEIRQELRA